MSMISGSPQGERQQEIMRDAWKSEDANERDRGCPGCGGVAKSLINLPFWHGSVSNTSIDGGTALDLSYLGGAFEPVGAHKKKNAVLFEVAESRSKRRDGDSLSPWAERVESSVDTEEEDFYHEEARRLIPSFIPIRRDKTEFSRGGVGAGGVGSGDGWYRCGAVQYPEYPNLVGFEPDMSEEAQQETLSVVWNEYLEYTDRHALKDFREIHSLINTESWMPSKADGYFWQGGWGPPHKALLHAFHIVDGYWYYIKSVGTCSRVGVLIHELIDEDGITLETYYDGNIFYLEFASDWTGLVDPLCPLFFYNRGLVPARIDSNTISIHHTLLTAYATVADRYLYHAHRIYQGVKNGLLPIGHMVKAKLAGQMALSAVLYISHLLLHEMVHKVCACDDDDCYPSRVSANFRCRLSAMLGLWRVDHDSDTEYGDEYIDDFDEDAEGLTIRSAGEWSHSSFYGSCEMMYPGDLAGYRDFTTPSWECTKF